MLELRRSDLYHECQHRHFAESIPLVVGIRCCCCSCCFCMTCLHPADITLCNSLPSFISFSGMILYSVAVNNFNNHLCCCYKNFVVNIIDRWMTLKREICCFHRYNRIVAYCIRGTLIFNMSGLLETILLRVPYVPFRPVVIVVFWLIWRHLAHACNFTLQM